MMSHTALNIDFRYTIPDEYLDILETKPFTAENLDLTTKKGRYKYFKHKLADIIDKLSDYLASNQVVIYMLAPKFAGKGLYSGLLRELFPQKFVHLSIGDLVREFPSLYKQNSQQLIEDLQKVYRGPLPLQEVIERVLNPDPTKLVPDEFILALLKYKISRLPKKSLIIDGFPRTQDQVYYALLFRDLIDYRDDKDIFLFINVPLEVIDIRAKYRVVCPICKATRNIRTYITEFVEYDPQEKQFYLLCDNPECDGYKTQRLLAKPGDELGLQAYAKRIQNDLKLMELARNLHGISKIEIFNALPTEFVGQQIQDYEVTPIYEFENSHKGVQVKTRSLVFEINGAKYVSLLAPPVIIQLVKQLARLVL